MIIDVVAGARPNFMKVAALFAVADQFPALSLRLIHTGQHYDASMSDVFFKELGLPQPTHHLEAGSGSHATQTAEIMKRYENWIKAQRPELCVVVGDVNSTIACALVAAKDGVKIAHVEAGLRSFDRTMPEEINRVLTDSISDLMFATEPSAVANLAREGRPLSAIHLVGHVMIDTLFRTRAKAEPLEVYRNFRVEDHGYVYLTLHRPANVDNLTTLEEICEQILWLSQRLPIIFPIHPRTRAKLGSARLAEKLQTTGCIHLIEPVGYLESVSLLLHARMVVTDSGGLQEESSALGVPCLTLRENTERPITLDEGTNTLIGRNWPLFQDCVTRITSGRYAARNTMIPFWDGRAGQRILSIIERLR